MIPPDMMSAFVNPAEAPPLPENDEDSGVQEVAPQSVLRFVPLLKMLEANGKDLTAACKSCNYDAMVDPMAPQSIEDQRTFLDALDELDEQLVAEFKALGPIPHQTALEVAEYLAEDGIVDDPELFAGFITRVSKAIVELPVEAADLDAEGTFPATKKK